MPQALLPEARFPGAVRGPRPGEARRQETRYGATDGLLVGSPETKTDGSLGRTEEVADLVENIARLDLRDSGKDNWGGLARGYLHPPVTGNYTFYIASDNESELWLSGGPTRGAMRKIADVTGTWTEPDQFTRLPSQKSRPVRLIAGKPCAFEVLFKERDGRDFLQVAWECPGRQREIIAGEHLSIEPAGPTGAARRLAWWDVPGGSVKELTASAKFKPDARRPVQTAYLVLNGRDQYVELRRDIAFQPQLGFEALIQPKKSVGEATLFEFISTDGKNRLALSLTADGKPRLWVRKAGRESFVQSPEAVAAGQWAQIGASISETGIAVLINGRLVAENRQAGVRPWDLRLDTGLLGRSTDGGFFAGGLTDVTFYNVPLSPRSPVAPRAVANAASVAPR